MTGERRKRRLHPLLLALLLATGCSSGSRDVRPNVVLISIDTLRADHLGCYGYPRPTSPAIDALAAGGVRFANAFAQASWTLPSHMSVMTSQYARVHGVRSLGRALPAATTTLAEVFASADYATAAFVSWVFVGRRVGFSQGFGEFHELMDRSHVEMAGGGGARRAEEITAEAIDWLRRPRTAPAFLFVHYFDPHMDYAPPSPYDTLFDRDYSGPARGTHTWLRRYIKFIGEKPARIAGRDRLHVEALYDGEIRYTDRHIGRLIDAIGETLGTEATLIILMSDHGEELDDHGSMEGHGWTLYDEVLHVPLIMRLPSGKRAGEVVEEPVELVDVGPTMLSLADLSVPPRFQGRDHSRRILGDAAGEEGTGRRLIYAESSRHRIDQQTLRGERYKLIRVTSAGRNAFGGKVDSGTFFFDVRHDPGEQSNLHDPENPIVRQFERMLDRKIEHLSRRAEASPPSREEEIPEEDLELLRSLGYVP